MNIDLVSENASPLPLPDRPNPGMQQVHVRELALALARREHHVTVWTRRDAADLPDTAWLSDAVRVRHLDAGPARPLTQAELVPHLPVLAGALRAAWRRDRPEVVHAHSWTSGMVALPVAHDLGAPTVQTFHALGSVAGSPRYAGSPAGRIRVERGLARLAGQLIATSSPQATELIRLGGPRRRLRVVPHGVDAEEFSPDGPVSPRGDRRRVVHAGRMSPRRGVDEIIAALVAVPDTELVLAGDFGPDDGDRRRVEEVADSHGVRDRLQLVELLPRDRVPELLRSADLVVCVPWFGQFGAVALEAMACARPVIASAVGGLYDTVVNGVTGAHVLPRRPPELTSVLRTVLGRPAMIEALGVAGRDRAVTRYGWDRIAAATEAAYREVAGR